MQVRVEVQGVSVNFPFVAFELDVEGVSWDSCAYFGFCGILFVDGMGVR
jgi:hypothetical protein